MAIDYHERRTAVSPNRPKKQPVSALVVAFALVIVAAYALGVATGWLFFRLAPKATTIAKPANVQLPPAGSPGSAVGQQPPGAPPVSSTPAAPLTFYETLPKGEKAVMGSGLNPRAQDSVSKSSETSASSAAAQSTPAPVTGAKPPAPIVPVVPKAEPEAPRPSIPPSTGASAKKLAFTVQVASTKDKADAEAIKARMGANVKGAYIVASQISNKGTWYRVRVGHRLDESQARALAARLGGGSVVVPE